jgi:subtilisin family serine protease
VGGSTYGVAKGVRLVAVRVLDCQGSGTTSGVIAGVDWVAANKRLPAVANMSLGGGASTSLDNAVAAAVSAGVTFVVAAGNSNADACGYSPARTPSAITVGATTSTDARASYSNFGSCLDLFAPGSAITSAWNTSNTATNTISGTSMASPHVAGVAALYLQSATGATPAQVANALTSASTSGKVTGLGSGSPNRLLFTAY